MRHQFTEEKLTGNIKIKLKAYETTGVNLPSCVEHDEEKGCYFWIDKLENILTRCNAIISNFMNQGFRLTLRQLYYQLVKGNHIPNNDVVYSKLSGILVKGRMGGAIDWDAIEDRIRVPWIPYSIRDVKHAIEDTIDQYRLNRQDGQENYIEVWCEKDALSGILKPITGKYHVKLMINRGYSSASAMYDAYNRFRDMIIDHKNVKILYLGDHDPSGLDMIKDIKKRIDTFLRDYFDEYDQEDIDNVFEVIPIGLTKEQIAEFNPPPNPAKITDPRAKGYIKEHGNTSWEVDALDPEDLNRIVSEAIEDWMDMDKYEKILRTEKKHVNVLKKFSKTYKG